MIENALIFIFGALSSALIALVVFPAFTRRAAKLARKRLERELPRTLADIAAMKDNVRAELAAKTAKVEVDLQSTREALVAERLARSASLRDLQAILAERRGLETNLSEMEERNEALRSELRLREEIIAKSNADRREAEHRLGVESERLEEVQAELQRAERATSEARVALAALDARSIALSTALEDMKKERDALEGRALDAEAKLAQRLADTAGGSIATGTEAADALIRERRQLVEENSQLRRERDRYRLAILPGSNDPVRSKDEPQVRSLTDAMADYRDGRVADRSSRKDDRPDKVIKDGKAARPAPEILTLDFKLTDASPQVEMMPAITALPAISNGNAPPVTLSSVDTGRGSSSDQKIQDGRVDALVRGLSHLRRNSPVTRARSVAPSLGAERPEDPDVRDGQN